jgi:FtsZ-interacting cell division protein ZipA
MSTVLVVVIVVVVVAVIALLLLLPRLRERARIEKRERELDQRRERVVEEHREEATGRERQAQIAEQRARVAEQEARRERAEAQVQEEKATLHEKGLADHELVGEDEREDFAGTSAVEDGAGEDRSVGRSSPAGEPHDDRDTGAAVRNGRSVDPPGRDRTSAYEEGRAAAHDPERAEDFREGRRREKDA